VRDSLVCGSLISHPYDTRDPTSLLRALATRALTARPLSGRQALSGSLKAASPARSDQQDPRGYEGQGEDDHAGNLGAGLSQ
jgi:hypothetical protein